MANRIEIIQFKSQKDINRDRLQKLEQSKANVRRQVEEIKSSNNYKKRVKDMAKG